jgi:hypothetical protein
MADSKTFTGGCHCGQVRFECTSDLAMVTACKEYLFNKHAIRHQLCVDCGVEVFARGTKPDGSEVVAVNVSCMDGVDLSRIKMTPVDGRNR